ncbi:MAG: 16S rRNA (cytosine(1402)-N(4))-methyltransferase RsmH [Pseudanabaenaceae cyanobacterium bins.68]|nr:16S rRNA (cytosine(1402)-N(4))-methyltransferase RsmH [Pseudanabaenaceae cyanobacterium bins.68]
MSQFHHTPVLPTELVAALQIKPQGCYLDCTVGGGGHSKLVLEQEDNIELVAIDQDAQAIAAAQANLRNYPVQFWQGNFADYQPLTKFDGIFADLGVSSAQLDLPERGFSFREPAPLDMRMDQSQPLTAAEIVNHWAEQDLVQLFFDWGEERFSRRIVRQILAQRPILTTTALAQAIAQAVPSSYRHGRIHPATRVFQALRIAVNQELSALEQLLGLAPQWLNPGGRLVIISFHSLEDRLVKHSFRQHPELGVITKKPIVAAELEIRQNPRSRSAKLRIAQKHSNYQHLSEQEIGLTHC